MSSMNQQWRNAVKDEILKERLLIVTSENKALKSEIEFLKLKIEAMEIADKMTMEQLRIVEKHRDALIEALKQNAKIVNKEPEFEPASEDEDEVNAPRILVSVERSGNKIRKTYTTLDKLVSKE